MREARRGSCRVAAPGDLEDSSDEDSGIGQGAVVVVTCPYCGEEVEIFVEEDVTGSFVQDCEVCCNPWMVRVRGSGETREVSVARADGSE
jgi:hypothetical protein